MDSILILEHKQDLGMASVLNIVYDPRKHIQTNRVVGMCSKELVRQATSKQRSNAARLFTVRRITVRKFTVTTSNNDKDNNNNNNNNNHDSSSLQNPHPIN